MKKKYWTTRMLSGVLSAVMVVSVAIIPMTASVAASPRKDEDIGEYVASLPDLEDVRDKLDKAEIVTAKDLEVDFGAEIDLREDLTDIKIPDKKKVSISFYEAKNEDGKSFTTSRADTYKAVGRTPTRLFIMRSLSTQNTPHTASAGISQSGKK